jgi:putative ABC transport system permease protein
MSSFNQNQPPKVARKLLAWIAGKADLEDIQGDMDEIFHQNMEESDGFKSKWKYWQHTLSLCFSYALKKRKTDSSYSNYITSNNMSMIRNYFKIAFRNFSKHKLFTSLNVIGLALGMSICLLALCITVAIYKSDEYHTNKDRIYQINTYLSDDSQDKTYASTFHAVGDYMTEKYPFIEGAIKVKSGFSPEIKHNGTLINFDGYFASPAFLQAFDFPLISGDPYTALNEPFSIILTKSVANVLYKNENPVGKILETKFGSFNVTGVIDNPKQTHLFFQILTSHSTYDQLQQNSDVNSDWSNYRNNYLYLLLKEGTQKSALKDALAQVSETALTFNPKANKLELKYVNLTGVVPRWNVSNALGIGWDQPSLIFFMAIGLLILLPAVFNYTNLSIARALKRAKEIGVRKVMGAEKGQIKAQFIVETILIAFLALIGSIFIFIPMRQEFLDLLTSSVVLDTSLDAWLISAFILFTLAIGFLAGIFPAQYFSRLNPINTMKGEIKNRTGSVSGIKKGLFVFQFFLSLVFLVGVGTMAKQYTYIFNNNHGFQYDNVLTIPFKDIDKQIALNELRNHPDVKMITTSSSLPGVVLNSIAEITPNGQDTVQVKQVFIGDDFIENLDIKLQWGESKSLALSNQNEELVLVNQQFMTSSSVFNLKKDSLNFTLADGTKCRIIGILEDFNFEPLSQIINPILFRYSQEESTFALLTINSTNIKKTVFELDEIWTSVDQGAGFQPSFLDAEIEKSYYFLSVQIKFFSYLSTLAITISCLGLLGMVTYTTENRTKEIAVRKIMGASTKSLYYLLTKDFVKLIVIAALIAIPFSYVFYEMVFMRFLLPYGSGLGFLEIFLSILFLFTIGFVSIYWQTSKVANANPSGNLRYE